MAKRVIIAASHQAKFTEKNMGDRSGIEWTDATWSPVTGCTKVSPACDHCWAERMAKRLKGRYGYPADAPFRITTHPDRLQDPLHWTKPRRIFVCSMGDLFHQDVPEDFIRQVFEVMRESRTGEYYRAHIYQILTKRPDRMRDFILRLEADKGPDFIRWPLPNVWIGVTAEDQPRADERVSVLLMIRSYVHFVSIEPLLGQIDLKPWIFRPCRMCNGTMTVAVPGDGKPCQYSIPHQGLDSNQLNWVICGGETGPKARPVHPDWVRSLRDQCQAAQVSFFFKSWGDYLPAEVRLDPITHSLQCHHQDGTTDDIPDSGRNHWWQPFNAKTREPGLASTPVGKKHSVRLLDGRTWDEIPG
jgi:protein gp37